MGGGFWVMKTKAELLHQTSLIHEYIDSHFDEIGQKKAEDALLIVKALWEKLERRK